MKRVFQTAALLLTAVEISGCKAHYVQAVVKNESGAPISLVEVDYPSASFGKDALAANAEYGYRFEIIGSGPTKVIWTDGTHKEHSVAGPTLEEGQQGRLVVTIAATTATWSAQLTH